jgi:REP-associated tyrosine transposase
MTQVTNPLNPSTWEGKYPGVCTPKDRKTALFGGIRKELQEGFPRLAAQQGGKIEEGQLRPAHIHLLISIPPKPAVASILGFVKGKSSIWVAQNIANQKQNCVGHKFWARGDYGSTVGADEKTVRAYIENRESEDKRLDELSLFDRIK